MGSIVVYNLSEEERDRMIDAIIDKYTAPLSETPRKTKWKDRDFVRDVIKRHIKYLTVDRNKGIKDKSSIITEIDAIKYLNLFNNRKRPNLDRLMEVCQLLDEEQSIGNENTNTIIKEFGNISETDKEKLLLKIAIINKFNYMPMMIENPRKFSLSPEYLYARLSYYSKINGNISKLPASRVLSDKDEYTDGNKKKITDKRKSQLLSQYKLEQMDNDESSNKGGR